MQSLLRRNQAVGSKANIRIVLSNIGGGWPAQPHTNLRRPRNLPHIVVQDGLFAAIIPSDGDTRPTRFRDGALVGSVFLPENAVADFEFSGFFACHLSSFDTDRLRSLGSIKTKPLNTNARPRTISEVPRACKSPSLKYAVPVISSTTQHKAMLVRLSRRALAPPTKTNPCRYNPTGVLHVDEERRVVFTPGGSPRTMRL